MGYNGDHLKMKKRVLVTGGAGFIGSHLVDKLVGENQVFVIDDLSGGNRRNLNPKAEFYKQDLRGVSAVKKLIEKLRPQVIYHLAANAAEIQAQYSPIEITSRNYGAFINTVVPAISVGFERLVFFSSIAVYGHIKTPFSEKDPLKPSDLYGVSKLAIEQTIEILSKVHGFEYLILRPHNVYGPRQNTSDPFRNVIAIFMNCLLKGDPYFIYGDGQQLRSFTYIDDLIEAILKCEKMNISNKVLNIGSDESITINKLSDLIQKVTGINIDPLHLPERQQEIKEVIADHSLSRELFSYKDRVSLEEGLEITWRYIKALGHKNFKFKKLEIPTEKVPANWLPDKKY